jgi:hypothetical protein
MKYLHLIAVFFILQATNVQAQNNDYLITTEGIGSLKLGMTQAELEKLIAKKVPLTNPTDTVSGSYMDSAKVKYKNIDVDLQFTRNYYANDSFRMVITWIRTTSPLCKTKTGVGIGADKLKIISAYEGYHVNIMPVFLDEEWTVKSKTDSMISVCADDEGNTIMFYLRNKKVVAFEIYPNYDDEEG